MRIESRGQEERLLSELRPQKSTKCIQAPYRTLCRFLSSGQWSEYAYTNAPGPCLEVLPWLHERRVAAVVSDTWAFEAVPSKTPLWLPIHAIGIVRMGLVMGEHFLLEERASNCARDGVHEAFLYAGPLAFSRAVGAPANPLTAK